VTHNVLSSDSWCFVSQFKIILQGYSTHQEQGLNGPFSASKSSSEGAEILFYFLSQYFFGDGAIVTVTRLRRRRHDGPSVTVTVALQAGTVSPDSSRIRSAADTAADMGFRASPDARKSTLIH
jgi:hypothetical protein